MIWICVLNHPFAIALSGLREQVKKLEDDKKKLIEQLVDYEELKAENERLKKQLVKQA